MEVVAAFIQEKALLRDYEPSCGPLFPALVEAVCKCRNNQSVWLMRCGGEDEDGNAVIVCNLKR